MRNLVESWRDARENLQFTAEPDNMLHAGAGTGHFFVGIGRKNLGCWDGAVLLHRDQARQLRDELTAFLGDKCERCAANEHLLYELPGLRDANEALRRDNADLTRQKDRLIKENVRLREAERARDALLAKHDAIARENTALRQRVASLEKDNTDLRAENASMKVDLMNARARNGILIAICSDTNAVSCQCETTAY